MVDQYIGFFFVLDSSQYKKRPTYTCIYWYIYYVNADCLLINEAL